jgi:hypothetical protein
MSDLAALPLPTREQAHTEALRHLAHNLRPGEQAWLANEAYDAHHTTWLLDIARRGQMGSWVRQRYRYDAQSETLYFMGERMISQAELAQARSSGTRFPI